MTAKQDPEYLKELRRQFEADPKREFFKQFKELILAHARNKGFLLNTETGHSQHLGIDDASKKRLEYVLEEERKYFEGNYPELYQKQQD